MATFEPRIVTLPAKHPDEALTYSLDFTDWTDAASISITTLTVGSGLTLVASGVTGLVVTMKLSGGTSGSTYAIYLKVTDADGEIYVVNATLAVTNPAA